jgi:thiosulfate/3-mercaptopyruvate sulfurtransferase
MFPITSRLAAFSLLVIAALAPAPAGAEPATPLVSPQWLSEHQKTPDLVVLDIRSAIDGGGEKAYLEAHIPGSVHTDYDKGAWRVMRNNVPFMLPSVPELDALIGDLGIDEATHVVVVPAGVSQTDFSSAARVYWTLKVSGVPNVSILDGGVAGWKAAGLPLKSGNEPPSPKIFNATIDKTQIAGAGDVEQILASHNATLIDARTPALYNGKEKAPQIAAYGHIPGAIDVDSASFYDDATNRLKPKSELEAIAAKIPRDKPAVSYCNTGHWAATDWFVLHELLGYKNVRLYDGSMAEWAADPKRPVASSRTRWDDLKKRLGMGL